MDTVLSVAFLQALRGPVIAPLGGEDLYLTPEGFRQYAAAILLGSSP